MILEPGNVFVISLVGIVAWLLMREIVTWYLKLNRIILLLERLNRVLTYNKLVAASVRDGQTFCGICEQEVQLDDLEKKNGTFVCPHCASRNSLE